MPELFSQKLKANFTPEQQDYYLQLENELKEILGGQTQEEVLASGDPEIIQKILKIKQEMLNFVLTKKTREMVKQEEEEIIKKNMAKQLENQRRLESQRRSVNIFMIEKKHDAGEKLTDNELKFLYGIDGFGLSINAHERMYHILSRVLNQRDVKKDVARILGCNQDQVSLTQKECLSGVDIQYHYGGLNLDDREIAKGIILPRNMSGSLYLRALTAIDGLELPLSVGLNLYLSGLITAKGLKLPESIGGYLDLSGLMSSDGLEVPLGIQEIHLRSLPDDEIEELKEIFPHVKFVKL